ncbi:MAG: Gfo/Idh/MocA family oxidoreductase, partial [Rhodobacteraceae bacterium]|nr:Gfo/Idh/MocA family oxidoreductase [Paracoccaceae bacterium]
MGEILNYGIIGCGMMGREHIQNIALLPEARVAAIYEPDEIMAAKAKSMAPNARLHATLAELLEDQSLDCLLIASPNHMHIAQMQEIAARRPLPLLIEKPLFTDVGDAGRIEELQEGYKAPVWVAMEYRYMPPVAKLIEEAQTATGGIKMLTIREHRFPFLQKVGNWNRFNRFSGGTLVEKCCHFFDLMRLILQDEPVRVMASAGQEVNHLAEDYDGEVPDIWDTAYVIIDFAMGARAMLELCM